MRILRSLVVQLLAYALVIATLVGMYFMSIHYQYNTTEPTARFFAQNIQIKRFNPQGDLTLDLQAQSLTDNIPSKSTQLKNLHGQLIEPPASHWTIQSDTAEFLDTKKQLHLQGHVKLAQTPKPLSFDTTSIIIDFGAHLIKTSQPVTITQGKSVTQAQGLQYNLNTHALSLGKPKS